MIQSDPGIDMDLILRARGGDRDSSTTLARWAEKKVYPYLYRITLDYHLAQDLCQDTLVEMARFLPRLTLEQPGDLRAWLYKTALSKVQHHYRRRRHRTTEALSSSERANLEARMACIDPASAALERQDLVQERVARPLGLGSMTVAFGFWAPCGGLQSTIEDFARLAIGIMDGALVTTDTLYQQVWRRHSDLWRGYGLGWFVQNEGTEELTVRHGGLTALTCSQIALKPRRKNAVVLFAGTKGGDPYPDMMRLDQDASRLAQDLLALLK